MKQVPLVCSVCGRLRLEGLDGERCSNCGGEWKARPKKSVAALVLGILALLLSAAFIVLLLFATMFEVLVMIFTLGQLSASEFITMGAYMVVALLLVLTVVSLVIGIVHTAKRRKLALAGLILSVLAVGVNIFNLYLTSSMTLV